MSFKRIKGQDRQIEILINAIKKGTIPHAYLFSGIHGIGKSTAATAMAKALNCRVNNDDFCDLCISCKKIEHHHHPDILWIKPEEGYIKIDQIRRMQDQIKYKPYEGKNKVVIIEKAEKMNLQSSNCLLKTLEEPPLHTVLILLTTAPYQLLPTIRSRCQRIMFQPLCANLILEILKERYPGKNGELKLIASLSCGSVGKAIRWMEGDLLKDRKLLFEKINRLNNVTEILDLAESFGENKEALMEILDLLKLWLRDLLIFKETNQLTYIINKDLKNDLSKISCLLSYSDLFEKMQALDETQLALQGNVNPRLALETMLLKLS